MRYIKKNNCYLDTKTGLEWSLENFGPFNWDETIEFCENSEGDWRLPSLDELMTLVDTKIYNPATELPDMVSFYYWSSTIYACSTEYAWNVVFDYGHDYCDYKDNIRYVRAVRGEMK